MIPVKLTLKGIYSYQEEQLIVFDKLAQEGLFGIFGPVGSGKSTIIEAIAFALYGDTERLNSRENRAQNMMNLKSKEMFIRFECLAGPRNDVPYLFSVKHYVAGKKNEVIRTERGIYKWDHGQWLPTEEKPEQIVGLSYDNFQRTIIIPQGKFSEFLHLGGAERTNALMEIFQLNKYDLDDKAKRIQDKAATELKTVQVQLAGLEEINIESLDAIKQRLLELADAEKEESTALNASLLADKEWEELKEIVNNISQQEAQLGTLQSQELDHERKEAALQRYETCQRLFKDLIDTREKLEEEYNKYRAGLNLLDDKLKEQQRQKEALNINYLRLQEQYHKRDENLLALRSVRKLAELKKIDKDLLRLSAEEQDHNKKLAEDDKNILAQHTLIKSLGDQLEAIRIERPDVGMVTALQQWFADKKMLQSQLQAFENQYADAHKRLDEAVALIMNKLGNSPAGIRLAQPAKELLPGEMNTELDELLSTLTEDKAVTDKALMDWELEQRMMQFAMHLEPGKPCPLCGATDHPKAEHSHIVADDRGKELQQKVADLLLKIDWIKQIQVELQHLASRRQEQQKELQQLDGQKAAKNEELAAHYSHWAWPEPYSPEEEGKVEEARKKLQALDEKARQINLDMQVARQQMEEKQAAKERAEKALHLISSSILAGHEKMGLLKEEILQNDLIKYAVHSPEQLSEMAGGMELAIKRTEDEYRQADVQLQAIQQEISKLEGRIGSGKQILAETEKKRQSQDELIIQRLAETGFEDQNVVKQILAQEINIPQAREEIRLYRNQLESTRAQLIILEEKRKGRTYNGDEHQLLQQTLNQQKAKLDNLKEETGRQKQALQQQQEQLDKKEKLAKARDYWQERHENLQSIRNLFRSRGFVDYVSSVYLHSLCQAANERFHKLSRQSLSLEMTDKNEFQVRDYLNEGKTRHIKTLSGGQTFQAALSLALALADNTQKLASRKQNFFFMDEGFGSLDKESLRTVMDTLKTLRKENRIVGIISHVEELQQEMDVYLSVSNSDTKGSIISYSWEN